MFSAFKKLTSKTDLHGQNGSTSPQTPGVQSMSHNLQKKFAKGCNYNMKIVIRGDRNTGKSCLLQRLQGGPFIEEYKPTEEIQVGSINWSYKNTEDVVKVEVWDVVDVAKKRKKLAGLKLGDAAGTSDTSNGGGSDATLEPGLDAQFLDVYKQAQGAIFVFDVTKPWTFEYVKTELGRVPPTIPVLVLANFYDMAHHAQVTRLQIADFVENFVRQGADAAEVRWGEVSMRNGFGLKFLHKFFNVPFLTLQRQSLLQQLELNRLELEATQEELDLFMESEDANYERFSDCLAARRRQAAEQTAPPPGKSIVVGQPSHVISKPPVGSSSSCGTSSLSPGLLAYSNRAAEPPPAGVERTVGGLAGRGGNSSGNLAGSGGGSSNNLTGSGGSCNNLTGAANGNNKEASSPARPSGPVRLDVDSFVPDAGDFDTFLEEEQSAASHSNTNNGIIDSSDDESSGMNPMVSKFAEEIDSDTEYDTAQVTGTLQDDDNDDLSPAVALPKGDSRKAKGFTSLFTTTSSVKADDVSDGLEDFLGDSNHLEPGTLVPDDDHNGYDSL